jgi:hypothetical protein
VSCVPEAFDDHSAVGPYVDSGHSTVSVTESQPCLRRHLQGPANKVSDNIGMAHNDLVRIFLLLRRSTVEVLAEGSFYSNTVLEELLKR